MNLEVFYLHSCARTSAYWLKDSDVLNGIVASQRLLSTAVMFQMVNADDLLPGPYDIKEPHVRWAMKSSYNYQWVLSYYESLCELAADVLAHKPNDWAIRCRLLSYIDIFPDEPFTPPPFLYDISYVLNTTEESYRNYYRLVQAKPGSYRRVRPPFWIKGVRRGPAIVPDQPTEAFDLSDDPFADLR